MDSRAQFDAWCTRNGGDLHGIMRIVAWEVWQASRTTIEVELPEKISPHNTNESGYIKGQAAMYDEAIDDCAEAIMACGISIKRES